jgi:hypothetical protein
LPLGELDDAGGFNKLMDAHNQDDKEVSKTYKFKSIKERYNPKDLVVECDSSQKSEEHDCLKKFGVLEETDLSEEL